jgi:hypothetical protein
MRFDTLTLSRVTSGRDGGDLITSLQQSMHYYMHGYRIVGLLHTDFLTSIFPNQVRGPERFHPLAEPLPMLQKSSRHMNLMPRTWSTKPEMSCIPYAA